MEVFRCAHTEIVDIDTLIPNPDNPNSHPKEQVDFFMKVLKFQGQRRPVTVSNRSGFITKGHGLLISAKQSGWKRIAIDRQDYESAAQEYADIVADNELARLAVVDKDKILADLPKHGIGLDFNFDVLAIPDFKADYIDNIQPMGNHAGEMEMSKELDEKNDYLVFIFSSKEDFQKACEKFGVKTVTTNLSTSGNPNFEIQGVGRVLDGKSALKIV